MRQAEIKDWLRYWRNARMTNLSEIGSLEDMGLARKFCPWMRNGIFWNVSDRRMWNALLSLIEDQKWAAHEAECKSAAFACLAERGVA